MVAKIESGKLDPAYSKVQKIEEAMRLLTKEHEKEAAEIMNQGIITVSKEEKIQQVIHLMNKHSISQVPVLDRGNVVGLISESTLLRKNIEGMGQRTAKEIMDDVPPIITKHAAMDVVKQLLYHYPLVLVEEKGKLIGLITKADLIKILVS